MDVLAVEVPGATVPAPDSNIIWAIIGGILLLLAIGWVIGQISKKFFVAVAILAVFVIVVLFANGTIGG